MLTRLDVTTRTNLMRVDPRFQRSLGRGSGWRCGVCGASVDAKRLGPRLPRVAEQRHASVREPHSDPAPEAQPARLPRAQIQDHWLARGLADIARVGYQARRPTALSGNTRPAAQACHDAGEVWWAVRFTRRERCDAWCDPQPGPTVHYANTSM
jgi:hypothetical protein